MQCHICKAEAVTRCYSCGELVCEEHSKNENCPLCSTGFTAADPRSISVAPLPKDAHKGWWRPQTAEEYKPPECYECKGLGRGVCRNCHCNYCAEHAGANGLCKACHRSANIGLYVVAAFFAFIGMLVVVQWIFG